MFKIYVYTVPEKRGTYVKTYLARITGEHPVYGFKRRFLRRTIHGYRGYREYDYQVGHGVYEQRIMRLDKLTDEVLEMERVWFVYFHKKFYEIDRDEVLFCGFNLSLQTGRKQPRYKRGGAA